MKSYLCVIALVGVGACMSAPQGEESEARGVRAATSCESLASLTLPNTTITRAEVV